MSASLESSSSPGPVVAGSRSALLPRLAAKVTTPEGVHVIAVTTWAALFAAVAVTRYRLILSQRYDLGNMTQAVWNTAHGRFLEVTEVGGMQVSRLGIHVDPLLAALAPLWFVWPSPALLVTAQAVALALGSFPVYWLARKHLGSSRTALKFSLVYLLYPSTQWNALHEFHTVAFAVPLLLLAIWYLDEDRLWAFAAAAVPAALAQEQIGLIIAGLGVWYGFRTRKFRPALVIAAAAASWTIVAMEVIIPHYSGATTPYVNVYGSVGGSPAGILRTFFSDPGAILAAATTRYDVIYLAVMTLPVLGLCFLSPLLLAAWPQLAINLLSTRQGDVDFAYQHALPIVPILIAATIFGIARFSTRRDALVNRILFTTVIVAVLIGPPRYLPQFGEIDRPPTSEHRAAQRTALALVPRNAPVSATNRLGGQLAERRYVYVFPMITQAEWVVVDRTDTWLPTRRSYAGREGNTIAIRDGFRQPKRLDRIIERLKRDPRWSLVFARDGVLAFERRG